MRTEPDVKVISNKFPEVQSKMTLGGRLIVKKILEDIAKDIEAKGPYQEYLSAVVKSVGFGGTVDVSPWWIGFLEFGSTTHASRPFVEPASEKNFKRLPLEMKALGDRL